MEMALPIFPVKRDDCIGGRWARLSASWCFRKSSWKRRSAVGEKDGKRRERRRERSSAAVSVILSIIITQTILMSNPPPPTSTSLFFISVLIEIRPPPPPPSAPPPPHTLHSCYLLRGVSECRNRNECVLCPSWRHCPADKDAVWALFHFKIPFPLCSGRKGILPNAGALIHTHTHTRWKLSSCSPASNLNIDIVQIK